MAGRDSRHALGSIRLSSGGSYKKNVIPNPLRWPFSKTWIHYPDHVFVGPIMIPHYIDAHEYSPPTDFQEAVLRCPEMRSVAYLRELKSRGLTAK